MRLGDEVTLQHQLDALRAILPHDAPLDRLVERAPALLVADLPTLEAALRAVMPDADPGTLLAATPELASAPNLLQCVGL